MVVGQFTQETGLAVVGGGAGGVQAALRAAELGMPSVIVDPRGACPHGAWLASKILADAARLVRDAGRAAGQGLALGEPVLDLTTLRKWTQQVGEALTTQLEQRCAERGVEVIRGTACFESDRQLTVLGGDGARLRFKRAVIATGASPLPPPGGEGFSPRVTPAGGILDLDRMPATLLVLGGDAIALELAGACAALGSRVTLLAPGPRLLPEADADLVRPLERRLGRVLDEIGVGVAVTAVRESGSGVEVEVAGGSRRFDHVAVALGAAPRTEGLGLDEARVETAGDGTIPVDERLRTGNPRILAVGDVTRGPALAGRALHEGRVAAEVAAGVESVFDPQAIPAAVFSDPPVAWCGLTEARAAAEGIPHEVRRLDWSVSGRAVSLAASDGLTKLVLDPESKLVLGVGVVGVGAAEMIGEGALAVEMGAVADDLAAVIHAHPTMSELLAEAARQTP